MGAFGREEFEVITAWFEMALHCTGEEGNIDVGYYYDEVVVLYSRNRHPLTLWGLMFLRAPFFSAALFSTVGLYWISPANDGRAVNRGR